MQWTRYKLKDREGNFIGYANNTIASDRGRYCICRTRAGLVGVLASAAPHRFIAFKGFSGDARQVVLGGFETSEAAKAYCAKHAEGS